MCEKEGYTKKEIGKLSLPMEVCLKLTIHKQERPLQLLYGCHKSPGAPCLKSIFLQFLYKSTFHLLTGSTCKHIEKSRVAASFLILTDGFFLDLWMLVIPTSGRAKCRTQSRQQAAFAWCQFSFLQTKLKQHSVSNWEHISKGGRLTQNRFF